MGARGDAPEGELVRGRGSQSHQKCGAVRKIRELGLTRAFAHSLARGPPALPKTAGHRRSACHRDERGLAPDAGAREGASPQAPLLPSPPTFARFSAALSLPYFILFPPHPPPGGPSRGRPLLQLARVGEPLLGPSQQRLQAASLFTTWAILLLAATRTRRAPFPSERDPKGSLALPSRSELLFFCFPFHPASPRGRASTPTPCHRGRHRRHPRRHLFGRVEGRLCESISKRFLASERGESPPKNSLRVRGGVPENETNGERAKKQEKKAPPAPPYPNRQGGSRRILRRGRSQATRPLVSL